MKVSNQPPIRVMRIIARMNIGGPAVQVSGLMRGLDPKAFEHRLYTGFCSPEEEDYLKTVAMDVHATYINGLGRRISLSDDLKAFFHLVREIRSFKPHIIHTHTAKAGFLGRVASIVSMQPSIRIHTFHGHLLSGYFGAYKRELVIAAEKFLAIFSHQLLAVGERVRQDLLAEKIGRIEKFAVMPPGLELGRLPSKETAREFYGLTDSTLQCAFIGRVTKIKRPDRFLEVVNEILNEGVPIEFLIAGDGELLASCREQIRLDKLPVKVLGWQSDIRMVLSAADIVVLTSDNEGTPLSLIQAGMAGLPVVSTNVGSTSEVVIDGQTGILTSLRKEDIAMAIVKLASDPKLRLKMGNEAKIFTLANFGVSRLVQNHEELYIKLL
jgi:glycosyltransferase involved in cell wall biosynthesis